MKNTITDFSTLLRSDFVPRKNDPPDCSRHRFNPGNPDEFEFKPTAKPMPVAEENMVAANVDDNGAALLPAGDTAAVQPADFNDLNEHIF